MKTTIRRNTSLQTLVLGLLLPCIPLISVPLQANPGGASVIHGEVDFETSGNTLSILQDSDKAIIEWDNFSIGKGEVTQFLQPGANSAALNRVTGGSGSLIDGMLRANGQVWLINQNGIIVGPGGMIDVNSLVLSTLDVNNGDFLDGNGQTRFSGPSINPVANYGHIKTADNGSAFFVAHTVQNHGQIIGGVDSRVMLIGGNEVVVDEGAGLVTVSGRVAGGAHPAVENSGLIQGGDVTLAAHGNAYASAIQNSGAIRATSADTSGGRVRLVNSGTGSVVNTGIVDASGGVGGGSVEISSQGAVELGGEIRAGSAVGNGGNVQVDGSSINVMPGAIVDASGEVNGGEIRIGSEGLAEAVRTGDVTIGAGSTLSAMGRSGTGGAININSTGMLLSHGAMDVSGGNTGGSLSLTGEDILIAQGSTLNAAGGKDGGTILADAQNTLVIDGSMDASGETGQGGTVGLTGEDIIVSQTGAVRADGGTNGGTVAANAQNELFIAGNVSAQGTNGQGGMIDLAGNNVVVAMTGNVNASGADGGGMINVGAAEEATILGTMRADGGTGTGGMINVDAADVFVGPTATVSADGAIGGSVLLDAENSMEVAGNVSALGTNGTGGTVGITGSEVSISPTAVVDASGATSGGRVRIGGGYQGGEDEFRNARNTSVAAGAQIRANGATGTGGNIAIWADGNTNFQGNVEAQGANGGGFVEVSGVESLAFSGNANMSGGIGNDGTLLLDPVNVVIGSSGITAAAIQNALATSNLVIHTSALDGPDPGESGTVSIEGNQQIVYDSGNSFSIFAHSDIDVGSSGGGHLRIANRGSGNINLVAGWDGTGADGFNNPDPAIGNQSGTGSGTIGAADILGGTYGTWGNNGDINLNTGGGLRVDVGSAAGETNLFGANLFAQSGDGQGDHVHIGYQNDTDFTGEAVTGDVNVHMKGNMVLSTGTGSDSRYIQFGHGGRQGSGSTVENADLSGDVNVQVGGVLAGDAASAYGWLKFGHGGYNFTGNLSGNVNVEAGLVQLAAGETHDGFVQFGHGGRDVRGNFDGDVNLTTTFGGIVLTGSGNVNSSNMDRSFLHIGHGGYNADHADVYVHGQTLDHAQADSLIAQRTDDTVFVNPDTDEIVVRRTNDAGETVYVNLRTGETLTGALDPAFVNYTHGHTGNVNVVSAGEVVMRSGGGQYNYAQIGHGGAFTAGSHYGNVTVHANAGDIVFDREVSSASLTRGAYAFSKIGHGGALSSGGGTGDIDVMATGAVEFHAGRSGSFAQIGHGGRDENNSSNSRNDDFAQGTHTGDISVVTGQDLIFRAGFGRGSTSFAMVGHGGFESYALAGEGHNGAISLDVGGDIDFYAGQDSLRPGQTVLESNRNDNFVMIGHGGRMSKGDHWGNIDIGAAGDITIEGSGGHDAIGFVNPNNDAAAGDPSYNTTWQNDSITGDRNFALIGHGGHDSEHEISTDNRYNSGSDSEGFGVLGASNITIAAGGEVNVIAAQKENARNDVVSDNFMTEYNESVYDRDLNGDGDKDDVHLFPDPVMNARSSFAQIGHGGVGNQIRGSEEAGFFGDITVTAGGNVTMLGSDFVRGNEPVDGSSWYRDQEGRFELDPANMDSTDSNNSYAMIGHGGTGDTPTGHMGGNISVTSTGGDLLMQAGKGVSNWAMIGHGGRDASISTTELDRGQNVSGHIDVDVFGSITMAAGERIFAFAQIGHGGVDFGSELDHAFTVTNSDISVLARTGDLLIDGGPFSARSANTNGSLRNGDIRYAMIGHGGRNGEFNVDADINVEVTEGNLVMQGGAHQEDFVKIGHGGTYMGRRGSAQTYTWSGDIQVDTGGDIILRGGDMATEDQFETVVDNEGDSVFLNGYYPSNWANNSNSFAQIGHGGGREFGDATGRNEFIGDISVNTRLAGHDVILQGGDGFGNFALIGHGGASMDNVIGATGNVTVNAANDILLTGGARFQNGGVDINLEPNLNFGSFAQIGHSMLPDTEGAGRRTGDTAGDIAVTAGQDITLQGGAGNTSHAMIGNGANFGFDGSNPANRYQVGDHTGDITVVAARNLTLRGGDALQADELSDVAEGGLANKPGAASAFALIGNGGAGVDSLAGGITGAIDVRVGNDLLIESGTGWNAFAKIGHGDYMYDSPADAGSGFREGDISVAVGENATINGGMIGHVDREFSPALALEGNTWVAVSRNNPFSSGTGTLTTGTIQSHLGTEAGAVLASALGAELRLYMPGRDANQLMAGTLLNGSSYVVPAGPPLRGDGSGDELIATEFAFEYDEQGMPSGAFTPEGDYPVHGYGRYNIYYAGSGSTGGGGDNGGGSGSGGGNGGVPSEGDGSSGPGGLPLMPVIPPAVGEDFLLTDTTGVVQLSSLQALILERFQDPFKVSKDRNRDLLEEESEEEEEAEFSVTMTPGRVIGGIRSSRTDGGLRIHDLDRLYQTMKGAKAASSAETGTLDMEASSNLEASLDGSEAVMDPFTMTAPNASSAEGTAEQGEVRPATERS